jgi:hypothetical protein
MATRLAFVLCLFVFPAVSLCENQGEYSIRLARECFQLTNTDACESVFVQVCKINNFGKLLIVFLELKVYVTLLKCVSMDNLMSNGYVKDHPYISSLDLK